MRALRQTSLEGPAALRLVTDAPVPEPREHEILIRVAAAGVNFRDVLQARGMSPGGPRAPFVAGFEAAGEIVAVGGAVTNWRLGAHVVGVADGAFAEYLALPAAAALPVPPGWTDQQAPGLAVNWPTALAALTTLGGVAAGQTVLIQAAAGGTGQAAVRLAKHYGATVVATASRGKHDVVRALGADHVVEPTALRATDVDLVLESTGGDSFAAALAAAKPVTGRVVVYGLAGGEAAVTNRDLVYRHQVHVIGLNIGVLIQATPHLYGALLGEMSGLIAAGVITPAQPTAYDLADGPKALAELEDRATVGKLILVP